MCDLADRLPKPVESVDAGDGPGVKLVEQVVEPNRELILGDTHHLADPEPSDLVLLAFLLA